MDLTFDTLRYAQRLRSAGVEPKLAEAQAEAVRDCVMPELVTKTDLKAALDAQTFKFGTMLVGASITIIGVLTAVIKLT